MNNLDKNYQDLLNEILNSGVKKSTRNGETLSLFGIQIRHKMNEGFPLLTTKKMYFKGIITELLWFLCGKSQIRYLLEHDCHIWDGDAYQNFLKKDMEYNHLEWTQEKFIHMIKWNDEFANKWGDLGPVYGKQWREWNRCCDLLCSKHQPIDQIANLIKELKTNPDSRRMMVSAWNVGELDQMTLPPCHYGFQVYTRELSFQERLNYYDPQKLYHNEVDSWFLDELNIPKRAISLMWNQRSVDTFLGLPFNIASYGLLLLMIANEVNMIPEELIGNLGDTHLYLNHIEQAKEQMSRTPYKLPNLMIIYNPEIKFDQYTHENFKLVNYESHPTIKAPLSN
jgi:thymidylate synthase